MPDLYLSNHAIRVVPVRHKAVELYVPGPLAEVGA